MMGEKEGRVDNWSRVNKSFPICFQLTLLSVFAQQPLCAGVEENRILLICKMY